MPEQKRSDTTRHSLHDALGKVRHTVQVLHKDLVIATDVELETYFHVLDSRLIVPLNPDYPLMIAITGSGSSGKSTLFNALLQSVVSIVHSKAGINRRVLIAIHPDVLAQKGFVQSLFAPFGSIPEKLQSQQELTEPGNPLYVSSSKVPRHMVLLDTPDFDTGGKDAFTNRDAVRPVLEASDILLYIFTNASYNNRENTLFLRRVLREIGKRKVFLIYRCSREFSDTDVKDHAEVVARNIYDENYSEWVMGIYRANEDDEVVRGDAFMKIRPLNGTPDIHDALRMLDVTRTRADFLRTALEDVCRDTAKILQAVRMEWLRLQIYHDVLRIETSWAVNRALESFPQKELLEQFLVVWEELQPFHIRVLKLGKKLAGPINYIAKLIRKRKQHSIPKTDEIAENSDLSFELNLKDAANRLRNKLQSSEISSETTETDSYGKRLIDAVAHLNELASHLPIADPVPRIEKGTSKRHRILEVFAPKPRSLHTARTVTGGMSVTPESWQQTLEELKDRVFGETGVSVEIREQLVAIALEKRAAMTALDNLKELISATLTSIPAIGAVTYVFITGDPVVGAASIQTALTGLIGLQDLFAVVSIPASKMMNDIDKRNLMYLNAKTFAVWHAEKVSTVEKAMLGYVSGNTLTTLETLMAKTETRIHELEDALAEIEKAR